MASLVSFSPFCNSGYSVWETCRHFHTSGCVSYVTGMSERCQTYGPGPVCEQELVTPSSINGEQSAQHGTHSLNTLGQEPG